MKRTLRQIRRRRRYILREVRAALKVGSFMILVMGIFSIAVAVACTRILAP